MTNELVTVYGTVRPRVDDGRRQDLTVTRGAYREAYDALTARVPENWILLGVSRWPVADAGTADGTGDPEADPSEGSAP